MKKKILGLVFSILPVFSFAQTPDMYPPPEPEPVEITPLNIVLFVVLPILLVIVFVLYRRWARKKHKK